MSRIQIGTEVQVYGATRTITQVDGPIVRLAGGGTVRIPEIRILRNGSLRVGR